MPLKFWDEAYLTATFLNNRTPSRVILYQTPMEHFLATNPTTTSFVPSGARVGPTLDHTILANNHFGPFSVYS
jgi:hypothetical protein